MLLQFNIMAIPKYKINSGKKWTKENILELKKLAEKNTPTGVVSLKIKRTEETIYKKASQEKISLKPTNKSPYNRKK